MNAETSAVQSFTPAMLFLSILFFFLVLGQGLGQLADLGDGRLVDWVGIRPLMQKANCFHSAMARCKSSLSSP